MSIIVPAGKMKLDWSPREEDSLKKTASAEDQSQVEDKEDLSLFEAAKAHLEATAKDACMDEESPALGVEIPEVELDAPEETEEVSDVPVLPDAPEVEKTDVAQAVQEVVDRAEEAEAMTEAVEEALEGVEEAIEGVRAAVGADGEIEVDIDVDEVEINDDDEGGEGDEGDEGGDLVVESEPELAEATPEMAAEENADTENCVAEDKVGMDKSASAEEFTKFAKLSKENRSKLVNYWTNMLNYPKDYVKLLVKDYEK